MESKGTAGQGRPPVCCLCHLHLPLPFPLQCMGKHPFRSRWSSVSLQSAPPRGHSQLPLGLSLGLAVRALAPRPSWSAAFCGKTHVQGAAPGAATSPLSHGFRLRFSKESRGRGPPHPVRKERRRSPLWGTGADFAKAGSARKGERLSGAALPGGRRGCPGFLLLLAQPRDSFGVSNLLPAPVASQEA